jgi:hypothetical protein
VFQGLAILVVLGIARKAVAIFRLKGHTKNEVDQLGGIMSNKLAPCTLLSPFHWLDKVKGVVTDTIKDSSFVIREATFVSRIPDYDKSFKKFFQTRTVQNHSRIQIARFAPHNTEDSSTMYYREDPREGWMPRYAQPAAPGFSCPDWKELFPADSPSQGSPIAVEATSNHQCPGRRMSWR